MSRIAPSRRGQLSEMIATARRSKRWNQMALAEHATDAMLRLPEILENSGITPTGEELQSWETLEVTRHHVCKLENCPAYPVGTVEKRGRLFAICVALDLDRDLVNRLVGGI